LRLNRSTKQSRTLSNKAAKSAFRKWRSRKLAGSLMPKIQPEMCSESSSQIQTQNDYEHKKRSSGCSRCGTNSKRAGRASLEGAYRCRSNARVVFAMLEARRMVGAKIQTASRF